MQAFRHRGTSWTALLALVVSMALPLSPESVAADRDGSCGLALVAGRPAPLLEAASPVDAPDHCLRCHWLNTLASASAGQGVIHSPSTDIGALRHGFHSATGDLVVPGPSSPRAPPART